MSPFYNSNYSLTLTEDTQDYDLSSLISDLYSFIRFKHNTTVLELKSVSDMDAISGSWEEDEGSQLYYIVYGITNNWNKIKVYPIPNGDATDYTLDILYKRKPTDLSDLTDDLDIIEIHADIITYYSVYSLLSISRNNTDINKINFYMKKFNEELRLLKKQTNKNFSSNQIHEIGYRNAV